MGGTEFFFKTQVHFPITHMGTLQELLDGLWSDYAQMNSQAGAIHGLLEARGETVRNDHIAFRTFDDPRIGIDVLAKPFVGFGYIPGDRYTFTEKKLTARHYEPPVDSAHSNLPKVFISQLEVAQFSKPSQQIVKGLVDQVSEDITARWDFSVAGRPWRVSYADYETLRKESEYGAWLAAFGFRANHFTVDVGALSSFESLERFNAFVVENGFEMNTSGGAIKGSPEVFLEQSSTLAARVSVDFTDGTYIIPSCYYEFAKRYTMPDGKVFPGFIAKSADKIFESTDRRE